MALFKKLKKDIGIDEETSSKKNKKKEELIKTNKKEPVATVAKTWAEEPKKEAPEKKVPQKETPKIDYAENMKKISTTVKGDADWLQSKGQLAVDVYQTDTDFCIQAPIAGMNQENLDIAIEDEMLIIKGEREEPNQDKEKKYFSQECYWGPFSREVVLPEDVDSEKIKASLKSGILLITIPKTKSVKKKIAIEID